MKYFAALKRIQALVLKLSQIISIRIILTFNNNFSPILIQKVQELNPNDFVQRDQFFDIGSYDNVRSKNQFSHIILFSDYASYFQPLKQSCLGDINPYATITS